MPVPLPPEGDSPIFAGFAAKIGTVPVNGYVAGILLEMKKPDARTLPKLAAGLGVSPHGLGSCKPRAKPLLIERK